LVDQILGIGGLSVLVFLSVRLTVVLRDAWRVQREDPEMEPIELL
jgi:hypothetical protein